MSADAFPMSAEDVADLQQRLVNAAQTLRDDGSLICSSRLLGKAEGVRLALSYINDYRNQALVREALSTSRDVS